MRYWLAVLVLGLTIPTLASAQTNAPRLSVGGNYSLENVVGAFPADVQTQGVVIQPAGATVVAPMGTPANEPVMRHRVTWALAVPGIILLPVGYLVNVFATFFIGISGGDIYGEWGFVPVIGPFVQAVGLDQGGWLITGAMQAAGVALMVIGFIGHDEAEAGGYSQNESGPTLRGVLPLLSQQATGLMAHGTF